MAAPEGLTAKISRATCPSGKSSHCFHFFHTFFFFVGRDINHPVALHLLKFPHCSRLEMSKNSSPCRGEFLFILFQPLGVFSIHSVVWRKSRGRLSWVMNHVFFYVIESFLITSREVPFKCRIGASEHFFACFFD